VVTAVIARPRRSAFVRHFAVSLADLATDLTHHRVDLAPHQQIVGAPRRHAAQMRENDPGNAVDQRIISVLTLT
jgi:hypothetical protein